MFLVSVLRLEADGLPLHLQFQKTYWRFDFSNDCTYLFTHLPIGVNMAFMVGQWLR